LFALCALKWIGKTWKTQEIKPSGLN
jgi:hypothetical protein